MEVAAWPILSLPLSRLYYCDFHTPRVRNSLEHHYILQVYSSLVNEHTSSTKWNEPTTKNVNRDRVFRSVKKRISSVVRIVRNEVYKHGWASFLASLERVGACIQECPAFVVGSPSANLFISPDGNVTVTSTHDQVPIHNIVFNCQVMLTFL